MQITGVSEDPLQVLPAESRAVLSLVLGQGRSYAEIARLLRMERGDVRARAITAAEQLAAAPDELSPDDRARVVDYLLGEQSESDGKRTRSQLLESGQGRAWALALAPSLAPVSRAPLPQVPPAPPKLPDAARKEREGLRRRPLGCFATLAAVTVALGAIGAALLLSSGGASSPRRGGLASAGQGSLASIGHTVRRFTLTGQGSSSAASGAAAIVRQSGPLLLVLQARGLAPNRGDAYAVWLFNAAGDAHLLGFVSPSVGPAGRFSSSVQLPADAIRFHTLIVTRETTTRPTAPGPAALRGALSLSP